MNHKKLHIKLFSSLILAFFTLLATIGIFTSNNFANADYVVANVVIFSAAGKDSSVSSGSASNFLNAGHSFILIENLNGSEIGVGNMVIKNCVTIGT